jgi:hypothetical protein
MLGSCAAKSKDCNNLVFTLKESFIHNWLRCSWRTSMLAAHAHKRNTRTSRGHLLGTLMVVNAVTLDVAVCCETVLRDVAGRESSLVVSSAFVLALWTGLCVAC